jgi:hypothetical protein
MTMTMMMRRALIDGRCTSGHHALEERLSGRIESGGHDVMRFCKRRVIHLFSLYLSPFWDDDVCFLLCLQSAMFVG